MLAVGTKVRHTRIMVRVLVFYATFNNISVKGISWRSVLLVEETGVPGENQRSAGSSNTLVRKYVLYVFK
jgi:hypothetical protein